MAEVEVGGVKFRGGKMVAILMALSTLAGSVFAGAEIYARWVAMEKKIASYSAPDLSGFDKKLAVMKKSMGTVSKEMASVRNRVMEVQQIVRDIRQDTRADAVSLENAISGVDKRSRTLDSETRAAMRQAEKTMRGIVASANERFDAKINRATSTARQSEKNIRDITESASSRFDAKINGIDAKLNVFEKRQDKKLRDALENPLLRK
jgi:predicted  nucleic acid-binding Zn-ribbon protein